ncbi:hypothetical protein BH23PLA1_BH23PLA1_26650 [soil metagenome]
MTRLGTRAATAVNGGKHGRGPDPRPFVVRFPGRPSNRFDPTPTTSTTLFFDPGTA